MIARPGILQLVGLFISMSTSSAYSQTPFTVDGSTLVIVSGSVGVRTSTPVANLDVNGSAQFGSGTTKSTFTAAGLLMLTSSGIQWADGSTSTTASSGSGGGASVSTASVAIAEFSFSNTVANCENSGSTISVSMNGGRLLIGFEGDTLNTSAGAYTQTGILINGSLVDGQTSSGLIQTQMASANYRVPASFTHLTSQTYSGTTKICLAKLVSAGVGYVCANYSLGCRLWAMEVR